MSEDFSSHLPGISCCIETSWIQEGIQFHTDAPWSDQIRVFHTKKSKYIKYKSGNNIFVTSSALYSARV